MNNLEEYRTVLMLCHDQEIDRRIISQAKTLMNSGVNVRIIALAYYEGAMGDDTVDGIEITRVGLRDIRPGNKISRRYYGNLKFIDDVRVNLNKNAILSIFSNGIAKLARIANRFVYLISILAYYRNTKIHDPLPFTSAYVSVAEGVEGEVIVVHDLPILEAGVEIARKRGAPLVYDAHELYPEQKSLSARQRKICSEAENRLIKSANIIFTVNKSIAGEMAARYGIPEPRVLLNALDRIPAFQSEEKYDLLRRQIGLDASRRILLYQGGMVANRNLEILVKAMSLLETQDVDLVFLGNGPLLERLKRIARSNKLLDSRVFFLPAVKQEVLLQHTASADVGIIPYPHVDLNSYYCTPNKLFEFIQAGLPILANKSPELERFVGGEGFGMVARMETTKQLAGAIDKAFLEMDFERCRDNLKKKGGDFTWSSQEGIYLDAMLPILRTATVSNM